MKLLQQPESVAGEFEGRTAAEADGVMAAAVIEPPPGQVGPSPHQDVGVGIAGKRPAQNVVEGVEVLFAGGKQQQVHIGVGKACPGQRPPPEPSQS